jgi:membrane protein
MRGLGAYVPKEIVDMLIITLGRQAGQSSNLIMAGVSVAIALFGASGAIENTTKALNVMYDKRETRNPVRLRLLSIILTIGALLLVALVAILLLLTYGQLVFWGLPEWWALLLSLLRWPVMIVVINTAIMLLFRYGANRERSAWQVTTRGVAAATVLWLLVTAIFFAYLQHFAGFTRSYSIFAGIIALMIWFNLSAMTILTGALIDARRKKPDTRRSV